MATESPTLMQIGEAAARTALSLRTLRHWDEVGLVKPSARSNGGFRLYSASDIRRIEVVKTMKPLDLSLDEIRELLELLESTTGERTPTQRAPRIEYYKDRTRSCITRLERDLAYASHLRRMLDGLPLIRS